MPEKKNLTFTINGKLFSYKGVEEQRERDFFQLCIKACKGVDMTVENTIKAFRENIPDSQLTNDELEQLFFKHERRRQERDRKKANKILGEKTGQGIAQEMKRATTPEQPPEVAHDSEHVQRSDEQELDQIEEPPFEASPAQLALVVDAPNLTARDEPLCEPAACSSGEWAAEPSPCVPEMQNEEKKADDADLNLPPLTTAVSTSTSLEVNTLVTARESLAANTNPRKSSESNAGWAADPKPKEHTAWERELMRRRDRAEREKERELREREQSTDAPNPDPPPPQRSSSPSLPQSLDRFHSNLRRVRSSRGSDSKKSKERRKDKRETDIQKMMMELIERTNEIQGRIAQLETASPRRGSSSDCISNPPSAALVHHEAEILSLVKQNEKGRTMLHEAAEKGAVDDVCRLLAQGADVEARDKEGRTPFLVAASLGHLPLVHVLSSKGANIDAEDRIALTAPALAAGMNQARTVEYLHLRGCRMGTIDRYGRAPVHHATQQKVESLRVLLSIDGIDVNVKDKIRAQTPLHYAAEGGFVDAVELLLKAGADIVTDFYGNGPLALSALTGHKDTTHLLVKHSSVARGWTPLHECVISGSSLRAFMLNFADNNLPDLCESDAAGQSSLQLSAMTTNMDNVDFLLSKGVELSHKDKLGRTALHLAASRGQLSLCKTLIRAGATIDVEDAFRLTPFHTAALHGHRQVSDYLCMQGADHVMHASFAFLVEITRRQAPSTCPLVVQAFKRDIKGKPVTDPRGITPDAFGRTALHVACLVGDEDGVGYLVGKNEGLHCSVRAVDERGWSALHWAACRDVIQYKSSNKGEIPGRNSGTFNATTPNDGYSADLSVTPLTPTLGNGVELECSIIKAASQKAIICHILHTRRSELDVPTDLRELRARDGRRPVDVAIDEGCDKQIIELLRPNKDYPQLLYTTVRWLAVICIGLMWGIVLFAPTAFYYVVAGKQLSRIVSDPFLAVFAGAGRFMRTMRQWVQGEEIHDYTGGEGKVRKVLGMAVLGAFFLFFALLPSAVNAAHRNNTGIATTPSPPPLAVLPLRPTATLTLIPNMTDTPEDDGGTPEYAVPDETGKAARNFILCVIALVWCLFLLLGARRIVVEQRRGHITTRAVSRRIDFCKCGNWAMVLFAVLDPLILSAVPFVVVSDDQQIVPFLIRSLVFDTFPPIPGALIALGIIVLWLACGGVACLCAAVTTSDYLMKKVSVLQPHTLGSIPPHLIHFLTHTLFLPVVMGCLRLYKCEYTLDGIRVSGTFNSSGDANAVTCYRGLHAGVSSVAVAALFLYIVTASTVGVLLSQPRGGEADVTWDNRLLTAEKAVYVVSAAVVTIFFEVLWVCYVLFFFLIFLLLVYVGRLDDRTSSITSVVQWRMLGYTIVIISLAAAAFLFSEEESSAGTLVFLGSLCAVLCLGAGLYRFNQSRFLSAERAEAFRRLVSFQDSSSPSALRGSKDPEGMNSSLTPPTGPLYLRGSAHDNQSSRSSFMSLGKQLPPLPQPLLHPPPGEVLDTREDAELPRPVLQYHDAHIRIPSPDLDASDIPSGITLGTTPDNGCLKQDPAPIPSQEPDGWVLVGLTEPNPVPALSSLVV